MARKDQATKEEPEAPVAEAVEEKAQARRRRHKAVEDLKEQVKATGRAVAEDAGEVVEGLKGRRAKRQAKKLMKEAKHVRRSANSEARAVRKSARVKAKALQQEAKDILRNR